MAVIGIIAIALIVQFIMVYKQGKYREKSYEEIKNSIESKNDLAVYRKLEELDMRIRYLESRCK